MFSSSKLEDDKIVLRAFQLLERLKFISKGLKSHFSSDLTSKTSRHETLSSVQLYKLLALRSKLRNLLHKRYNLILKVRYGKTIERYDTLFDECWSIAHQEKRKLKNLSVFGYNQFPEKHVFDLVSVKMLPEKLYQGNHKWHIIDGDFRRILSLSHRSLNHELMFIFQNSHNILMELQHPLLCLVSFYLKICLEKFCYFDSSNLSPEIIHNVSETCNKFNNFLSAVNNKHFTSDYCSNTYKFRLFAEPEIKINWADILIFLANHEAKMAASKILSTLVRITRKMMKESGDQIEVKWLPDGITTANSKDVTSDYSSASTSQASPGDMFYELSVQVQSTKERILSKVDLSVTSVFESIFSRNQALLLKYLFVKSNKSKLNTDAHPGKNAASNSTKKTWEECSSMNNSYLGHQRNYWQHFWKKIDEIIFKILLEVPAFNHTDILPGTILLWKDDFLAVLVKILEASADCEDFTPEGQVCLRNIFYHIFSCMTFMAWDKKFCAVTAAIRLPQCSSVPLSNGNFGTKPGNLFCTTFEPLFAMFHICKPATMMQVCIFKALYCLISLLDCFHIWVDTRQRALLSSWNFSTSLTIAYSDVERVQNLANFVDFSISSHNIEESFSLFMVLTWNELMDKVDAIKQLNEMLPILVHKRIKKSLLDRLMESKNSSGCLNLSRICCDVNVESLEEIVEMVLTPLYEGTARIRSTSDQKWRVFEEAVSAVALSYTNMLSDSNLQISSRNANLVCREVSAFVAWIEGLELPQEPSSVSDKCGEATSSMAKALNVSKCSERRRSIRTNKVRPV